MAFPLSHVSTSHGHSASCVLSLSPHLGCCHQRLCEGERGARGHWDRCLGSGGLFLRGLYSLSHLLCLSQIDLPLSGLLEAVPLEGASSTVLVAAWHCSCQQVGGLEPASLDLGNFRCEVWDLSEFLSCQHGHSTCRIVSAVKQVWPVRLAEDRGLHTPCVVTVTCVPSQVTVLLPMVLDTSPDLRPGA